MTRQELQWKKATTLSGQIRQGRPVAKEFSWATDVQGNIYIRCRRATQTFTKEDYQALISYVSTNPDGVPLGARHDRSVPSDSIGALMQRRRRTSSIRGWCSHLAAIAVVRNDLDYYDKGRGPGRGIWLYPRGKNH
jgi:hypothetical protein